eukprot:TRINITY_DN11364_c0_g1_i1.p2 TRINITY_DN11364_c0_g1~~TRINITY_DN11364_c0_g1_i1.p2  ORF type:complete len:294 (+),score=92.43 TRINITY_DN11364_c0_g1_i1:91-882(+)
MAKALPPWWQDPTLVFVLQTFAVVAVASGGPAQALAFFTDKATFACFALWYAAWYWGAKCGPQAALEPWELRAANWYLLNGVVFHFFMDGLCGGYGFGGPLGELYKQLDRRVVDKDPGAWTVFNVELFIMTPLCVLTHRAIRQGLPGRHALEVCICTLHIFGTIQFVFSEIVAGCVNVPTAEPAGGANGPCGVGILWPPTMNQLVMFWFGFVFANIPWAIVPARLLYFAYKGAERAAAAVGLPGKPGGPGRPPSVGGAYPKME